MYYYYYYYYYYSFMMFSESPSTSSPFHDPAIRNALIIHAYAIKVSLFWVINNTYLDNSPYYWEYTWTLSDNQDLNYPKNRTDYEQCISMNSPNNHMSQCLLSPIYITLIANCLYQSMNLINEVIDLNVPFTVK